MSEDKKYLIWPIIICVGLSAVFFAVMLDAGGTIDIKWLPTYTLLCYALAVVLVVALLVKVRKKRMLFAGWVCIILAVVGLIFMLDASGVKAIDTKALRIPRIFARTQEIDPNIANALIGFGIELGRKIERIEQLEWQLRWSEKQWQEHPLDQNPDLNLI